MLKHWIWLTTRNGIGARTVMKVLEHFSSPEEAFYAQKDDYIRAGFNEKDAAALSDKDEELPRAIISECGEKGIQILTLQDAAYSDRLRNISDPPAVLYYKGYLPVFDDEPLVAVIGSRKCTIYAMRQASQMGAQIGNCGGIVVSGLAAGGDAMAMSGAISTGQPVVGVLGCGVDIVYPRSNKDLFDDVVRRGCLISEYPPGTRPTKYTFPARNRIISGLSLGVVVIEAPAKSGTLITADFALEQGRDLFAMPGPANSSFCAGSNRLIKEGAIPVESGWEVMREYQALYPDRIREVRAGQAVVLSVSEMTRKLSRIQNVPIEKERVWAKRKAVSDKKDVDIPNTPGYIDVQGIPNLSDGDRKILAALENGPCVVDDLIAACGGKPGPALSALTMLEIRKIVCRLPANRYELAKKENP